MCKQRNWRCTKQPMKHEIYLNQFSSDRIAYRIFSKSQSKLEEEVQSQTLKSILAWSCCTAKVQLDDWVSLDLQNIEKPNSPLLWRRLLTLLADFTGQPTSGEHVGRIILAFTKSCPIFAPLISINAFAPAWRFQIGKKTNAPHLLYASQRVIQRPQLPSAWSNLQISRQKRQRHRQSVYLSSHNDATLLAL